MDEISVEGHRLRRLRPLVLERDEGVAFLLVWTAMHRIDATSPLFGLGPADLQRLNAEVLVAFSGVDETIERSLHAQASWPEDQIRFGACFADTARAATASRAGPKPLLWITSRMRAYSPGLAWAGMEREKFSPCRPISRRFTAPLTSTTVPATRAMRRRSRQCTSARRRSG